MDLEDLRDTFKADTGRFDLNDAGVDRFLNAGQRYLDSRVRGPQETARFFTIARQGSTGVTFSAACRVIESVWAGDSDHRTKLEKIKPQDLRNSYNQFPEKMTPGRPLYYMPAVLRLSQDQPTVGDLRGYLGYMDVVMGASYGYTGVIFYPPLDQDYMVEVWGKFFTAALSDTSPASFWSANHDHLLLMAAKREHEASLRNSEGVKDFDLAMAPYLDAIDRDVAEQEAVGIGRMEG